MSSRLWDRLSEERDAVQYSFGTRRAVRPLETLRRVAPFVTQAGITRLADVTRLDRVGIPVYQAIRPNSRNLSVSQGKGLTRALAQVSALMESLEGFHAEKITQPVVRETVGAMRRRLAYDPFELCLCEPSFLSDDIRLVWVAATDLWTGANTWVPKELCDLNWCVEERHHLPLFRASGNGLASGNTTAEALVHGLCEVVERDATWRSQSADLGAERSIALSTIYPRLAQRVLNRLAGAGLTTSIVDQSGPTGLPSFEVSLHDPDSPVLHGGYGCHPSRLIALLRAITEAAQSRLTIIAGSRDDIDRRPYRAVPKSRRRRWATSTLSFRSTPSVPLINFSAQVRDIARRIRAVTGMSPVAVDLMQPEFGIPVVFVIAPGLRLGLD